MAANLESVVKQLADSGIVAPGKLENFVPPKAHPASVDELVAELVKNQHLMPFQAAQVKAGKAKALILGEYTIVDRIGAGGMGQVFKAVHRRMERTVAIKMLPPAMTKDAAALARFQREVVAAAKLSHQNIVAAYDAGQAGAAHFLVMEYVDGRDLSAIVKKDGPLPVNKAVNYILQAARGLEYAHSEGIVHRDIKPANLLLDKKGIVKILDMGLARIDQAEGGAQAELTGTGTIMGTVDYMSPEQAISTKNADARSDIYSLGISLYYLLAGKAAYAGDTAMEKLMAHQTQPIPALQEVQATVSKQLDAVFKKMVAKRVEQRYQTMSEVVTALESLGYGSLTMKSGEVASTMTLSSADKKRLKGRAKKKSLASLSEAVASEKTKYLFAKIAGGAFATIVAPLLVTFLIRYLDRPPQPVSTAPVAVTPSTPFPLGEDGRRPGEGSQVPAVTTVAASADPHPSAAQPPSPEGRTATPARRPDEGVRRWQTPAFQQWVADTQKLPAEQQIEAVSKKLMELNPGFDGKLMDLDGKGTPAIENSVVTKLRLYPQKVTDISPVRALSGLKWLYLSLSASGYDNFSDLTPLEGMSLERFGCNHTCVSNLSPLAECKSLVVVDATATKVTPGQVAALQKALPNCKIEWNDPAKAPAKKLAYLDPAFQKWVAETQKLPAEKQIEAVSKKLMELNPGFDGMLRPRDMRGVITEVDFRTNNVVDISPIRAFSGLTKLNCSFGSAGGKLADLSPLIGTKLEDLACNSNQVTDVSPLVGLPLRALRLNSCAKLVDISPLAGMQITLLDIGGTKVTDISALRGMPLTFVLGISRQVSDFSPLEECKNLKTLNLTGTKVTAAQVATLQKILPNCKIEWDDPTKAPSPQPARLSSRQASPGTGEGEKPKLAYLDPAFQQWVADTQKLPAEKQIEAVSKKLMELNPGFDGRLTDLNEKATPKVENEVVSELRVASIRVTDLSPLRALAGLKKLNCDGTYHAKGLLADLSPLAGLGLNTLSCGDTQVDSLSPVQGMPLTALYCERTAIADLSALHHCKTLRIVIVSETKVTLNQVAALQRAIPTCKIEWPKSRQIYSPPKKLAYLDPAFQQWVAATQKLPAEQQIEAVSRKLVDLNPGFDGKLTSLGGGGPPAVSKGAVTHLGLDSENISDLSPLRALPGLKHLACRVPNRKSKLADLSPVRGLPLEEFTCAHNAVSDLSPLEGMPLIVLAFSGTRVSDLTPLAGMRLNSLNFQVSPVTDISALRGMPLVYLNCGGSPVADLSPLAGMKLVQIIFTPASALKGIDVLRSMASLKEIGLDGNNRFPPAEFWKKYDAGEFGKPPGTPQASSTSKTK